MLLLAMLAAADLAVMKKCEVLKPLGSHCQWHQGVLSAGNGAYSSRLGLLDSPDQIIAIQQPGTPNPNEYAPPAAAKILKRSPNLYEAKGSYRVCPVNPDGGAGYLTQNHLKLGCIAGERNVVPHKK